MTTKVLPVWVQGHYRLRNDDGSLATATYIANEDTSASIAVDTTFRLRISWGESAGQNQSTASGTITLQFDKNASGTWTTVGAATAVKTATSSQSISDATADNNRRLTLPTGVASFSAGEFDNNNSGASRTPVDQGYEYEFCLQIDSAQVVSDDSITFRLLRGGATFGSVDAVPTLTVSEAPTITVQPANQTADEGSTATFTVTATGATSYQWQVDDGGGWVNVSTGTGGTTASYTTPTLTAAMTGDLYRVQVTNAAGTTDSSSATLTVTAYQVRITWAEARYVEGASGDTTIDAAVGNAVAAGAQASIALSTVLAGSVGNAVAAGAQASVAVSTVIAGSVGNAAAAGATADIALSSVIAASVGNAVAAGQQASIALSAVIDATAGNAVADGAQAGVTVSATIAANVGNATAAGATADVALSTVIAGAVGNATAAGATADISEAASIAANVGNAVAAGQAAQVGSEVALAASVGNAAAAGATADIALSTVIAATAGNAVADGVQATLLSDTTVDATAGNAVAAGAQASIAQSTVIDATAGNAVADGSQAAVSVSTVISASVGNAAAAGAQASIAQSVVIAASVGDAAAAGATADVSQAGGVTASVGDAVAAGAQASIGSETRIAALVGDAVAAGYAATIEVFVAPTTGGSTSAPLWALKKLRYRVRIGDKWVEVASAQEAMRMLEDVEQAAQEAARIKATEIAARKNARVRAARKAAPVVQVEAVEGGEQAAALAAIQANVAAVNARIQQMYVDALRVEMIGQSLRKMLDDDEDESLVALLL